MGVDRRDYIIYGWKLPFWYFKERGIETLENKFLPLTEGYKAGSSILIEDGMNGQYCVFGYLHAESGQNGFEFFELSPSDLADSHYDIHQKFIDWFGFKPDAVPVLMIFAHYF